MLRVALLPFLLPGLVMALHSYGRPCLDPFTGTVRSHNEVWARTDLHCSGIICEDGFARPSECKIPDAQGNLFCRMDTLNRDKPYPYCCPTLNCAPVYPPV